MFNDLKVIIGKREDVTKENIGSLRFMTVAGFIIAFGYILLEIPFSGSMRTYNYLLTKDTFVMLLWVGWFIISLSIVVYLISFRGFSKRLMCFSILSSLFLALAISYNMWGIRTSVVEDVTSTKSINATIISSNDFLTNSSFTLNSDKGIEVVNNVQSSERLKVGDKVTEITKRERRVVNTDVFGKRFILKEEINYLEK